MFNRHILLISLIALIVLVISAGSGVVAAPLAPHGGDAKGVTV